MKSMKLLKQSLKKKKKINMQHFSSNGGMNEWNLHAVKICQYLYNTTSIFLIIKAGLKAAI